MLLLAAPLSTGSAATAACEPSLRARLALEVASARLACNPDLDLSACAAGACGVGFGGPWDVAAAACILKEAGGSVVDPLGGGAFDLMSRRVLAANSSKLAEEIVKKL